MKERPILFSAPMVRAILVGRKTQTRRVVKPQPELSDRVGFIYKGMAYGLGGSYDPKGLYNLNCRCPYGQPGDRLWVRESARVKWVKSGLREAGIKYVADGVESVVPYPSRLAPAPAGKLLANGTYREASRILLEITAVRVERLNDISEEDAKAEGAELLTEYLPMKIGFNYRQAFGGLWESINGYGSWEKNPWVWVVKFRRIENV